MYADRDAKTGVRPGALSVAIGLNGAIIAALMLSAPNVIRVIDPTMITENIPLPPDPPPIPEPKRDTKIERPEQRAIDLPPTERPIAREPIAPINGDGNIDAGPLGGGVGVGTVEPPYFPPQVPVWIKAQPDPRYAGVFQPGYPPGERRAGNEGRVTVRVLIGVDGRVREVELVSAASDQFFAATKRQALQKWRFRPATRDGIPQEEWRTMSVSFVLDEDG